MHNGLEWIASKSSPYYAEGGKLLNGQIDRWTYRSQNYVHRVLNNVKYMESQLDFNLQLTI